MSNDDSPFDTDISYLTLHLTDATALPSRRAGVVLGWYRIIVIKYQSILRRLHIRPLVVQPFWLILKDGRGQRGSDLAVRRLHSRSVLEKIG